MEQVKDGGNRKRLDQLKFLNFEVAISVRSHEIVPGIDSRNETTRFGQLVTQHRTGLVEFHGCRFEFRHGSQVASNGERNGHTGFDIHRWMGHGFDLTRCLGCCGSLSVGLHPWVTNRRLGLEIFLKPGFAEFFANDSQATAESGSRNTKFSRDLGERLRLQAFDQVGLLRSERCHHLLKIVQ